MTLILALRTTLVLAATLAAHAAARRMPATTRRDLLTLGLLATLLVPALSWAPSLSLPLPVPSLPAGLAEASLASAASALQEPALPSASTPWAAWLWLWGLGAALVAGRTAVGVASALGLRAGTQPVDRSWARAAAEVGGTTPIRSHGAVTVPLVLGWLRPMIVVPPTVSWTHERRVRALHHELAHVHSADNVRLLASRLLCAVHWFNPLAWHLTRVVRLEMEHAADDAVVSSGADPLGYAGDLIEVARARCSAGSVSLGGSDLERRVRALASSETRTRPRRALGAMLAASAVLIGVVSLPAGAGDPADPGPVVAAEVRRLVDEWQADAVAIVVVDARSGEVVATGEHGGDTTDRPWSSGSVVKPFVAVAALDAATEVDAETIGHWLEVSSNDGFEQLATAVGSETLAASMRAQGLSAARPAPARDLALGQFPTTTRELALAYRSLPDTPHGLQVRDLLIDAVHGDEATGGRAAIPGVTVAGKTGTTSLGASDGALTLASFVGLVPAEDPRWIIAVQVATPGPRRWGGLVAAPAFARLAAELL